MSSQRTTKPLASAAHRATNFFLKSHFFQVHYSGKKKPPESEIGLLERRLADSFAYFMDMLHQAKPLPSVLTPTVNGKKTPTKQKEQITRASRR